MIVPGAAIPRCVLVICKGVVFVRFEKDFTSRHRLKEWLESKSWKFDSMDAFYAWLEKFIDEEIGRASCRERV